MWNRSYPKLWGRLFERYCDEYLSERKVEICRRADEEYRRLLTEMPDLGKSDHSLKGNMSVKGKII